MSRVHQCNKAGSVWSGEGWCGYVGRGETRLDEAGEGRYDTEGCYRRGEVRFGEAGREVNGKVRADWYGEDRHGKLRQVRIDRRRLGAVAHGCMCTGT